MASRALKVDQNTSVTNEISAESTTTNEIAIRAYMLWIERGRPIGSDQEDWFKAENELKSQKKQSQKTA